MSYFDISGATFDENLRKLETSDPAHADVFNALLGQLINNDVALKEAVTKFAASKNEQALFLLNLHKDGKKYGVHFDNYDVTPSSNGTRLFDAVGMAAAPSTNTVRAVNDFDGKGCFAYLEVNGSVDENGEFQVQYIKDIDNEFSRTKYDTWCLYLTQYVYRKFDSNGEDTVISDTRHSAEWLPEGGAIRPDGTIRPFVAIPIYQEVLNYNGRSNGMIKILLSKKLGEMRLTQADLARATGIRPNTINELYHELADRVNLEHLDLICEALDCELDELIVRVPNKESAITHTRQGTQKPGRKR